MSRAKIFTVGGAVAALGLVFVAAPVLADDAACEAVRSGRPFQLTSDATSSGRAHTIVEQNTPQASGGVRRLMRIDDQPVVSMTLRNGFVLASRGAGMETQFEYRGIDPSNDPYAGDRPFDFTLAVRGPGGNVNEHAGHAEPAGSEVAVIGSCRFTVRLWRVEQRPSGSGAQPSILRYRYSPELHLLLGSLVEEPASARGSGSAPREITTQFAAFE